MLTLRGAGGRLCHASAPLPLAPAGDPAPAAPVASTSARGSGLEAQRRAAAGSARAAAAEHASEVETETVEWPALSVSVEELCGGDIEASVLLEVGH
jgi:hypothetical protein